MWLKQIPILLKQIVWRHQPGILEGSWASVERTGQSQRETVQPLEVEEIAEEERTDEKRRPKMRS